MGWQSLGRGGHDPTRPADDGGDLAHPVGQRGGDGIGDIVDAAGGSPIDHCQGDRRRHILDIATGGPPGCHLLRQQDRRPAVVHALENVEEAVLIVAWPVDHRQTQDGAGESRVAQHDPLHQDLVVVVGGALGIIGGVGRVSPVGIETRTKR
jgi:hypothetical protein